MAEVKISDLTSATTPLAGTEIVPIVQGGVTKKVAVSNFREASGIHAFAKPKSGDFITALLTNGGYAVMSSVSANKITLVPFIPARTINYTSLSLNVIMGDVGTPSARILIYSDSDGVPSSKLYESASLPVGFSGFATASTTGTLTKGTTYWIGMYTNSAGTVFDGYIGGAMLCLSYSSGETMAYINVNSTFGSAPSTISSGSLTYNNTPTPIIFIA